MIIDNIIENYKKDENFVYPCYNGYNFANINASILNLFGISMEGALTEIYILILIMMYQRYSFILMALVTVTGLIIYHSTGHLKLLMMPGLSLQSPQFSHPQRPLQAIQ